MAHQDRALPNQEPHQAEDDDHKTDHQPQIIFGHFRCLENRDVLFLGRLVLGIRDAPLCILQLLDELRKGLVAILRIAGHRLANGVGRLIGDIGDKGFQRNDTAAEMFLRDRVGIRSFVGRPARHGVKERGSQAVEIAPEVFLPAFDFFGRDVIRGAPNLAFEIVGRLEGKREAEVDNFGRVIGIEENVAGFDVAVDQAPAPKSAFQPVGDRDADFDSFQFRDPAQLGYLVIERATGNVLGHHVIDVLVLSEGVDLDDVRVIEGGGNLHFAQESGEELPIGDKVRFQDLDGHHAVQGDIPSEINSPHAPRADLLFEEKVSKLTSDNELVVAVRTGDTITRLEVQSRRSHCGTERTRPSLSSRPRNLPSMTIAREHSNCNCRNAVFIAYHTFF